MFSYCLSFLGSFTSLLSLVLLCLSHGIQGLEDHMMQKPECQMWAKLENKTLPLQDQGHANCTTNSDCTGFTCKGIYQVSPVHLLSYSHHGVALFLKWRILIFLHLHIHDMLMDILWNRRWIKDRMFLQKYSINPLCPYHQQMVFCYHNCSNVLWKKMF